MISHKHKSIFVHIPKTGGTSIELALRDHSFGGQYNSYMNGKRATRGWDKAFDSNESPIRENSKYWIHKHRPVNLIKPRFKNYRTFAFVRNPWDLVVSSYHWWTQKTEGASELREATGKLLKQKGFDYFVKSEYASCINECDHKNHGQLYWLTDEKQNIIVDYVGRFENLNEHYAEICENIGISKHKLPHALKSRRKKYTEYYTKETIEIIEKAYNADIQEFKYSFGDSPGIQPKLYVNFNSELPTQSVETKIETVKHEPVITEKNINVVSSIANTYGNLDCDTLICINSCEKHEDHLQHLKNSEFYQKLKDTDGIGILEFYRGHESTKFENGKLLLQGIEQYDKLHVKTYDMIQWCIQNLRFNRLVKLDCNFLTYNHVGERTRKKICGIDRVEKSIYKRKFVPYVGSNGREFLLRDFRAWSKQKGIVTQLDEPTWLKDGIWYYCGKCYRINYEFAKFIATSEICKNMVKQHDVKNALGFHPFAVEDVMIGRMHEAFLESE